jgi:hypothetical protein
MEVLGFIDTPGAATTWTTTETPLPSGTHTTSAGTPTAEPPSIEEILETWVPNDVDSDLTRKKIRWGRVAGVVLFAAFVGVVGYWLYTQPAQVTAQARAGVVDEAMSLQGHLDTLAALNATLAADALAAPTATADLLAADDQARSLFDVSGALPPSHATSRSLAADAAGDVLDASRLVGDAIAYRAAITPVLVVPELETDSALIELDDAALLFGEWRSRFDRVRAALPTTVLSEVSAEFTLVSGEINSIQTRYLDSLRNDDAALAASTLDRLANRLAGVEVLLGASLADIQTRVTERLASAGSALDLLVG